MIGGYTFQLNGAPVTVRFSARAQLRVERELGVPLSQLENRVGNMEDTVILLAAMWNDGKGADSEVALDAIDALGNVGAIDVIANAISAAFPEVEGGDGGAPGKPKPGPTGSA